MSALRFDATRRCPLGAACMSCGVDFDGARVITDCPAGPDTCGAPSGTPCEPWCASQAAEPEPGPLRVAILGTGAAALCVTLCWGCSANGLLPTLTGDAARRLIIEHREHGGEVTGERHAPAARPRAALGAIPVGPRRPVRAPARHRPRRVL